MLDTENDNKRRKTLTLVVFNGLKYICESIKVTLQVKIRIFRSYMFLYNSELWTLT